VDPVLAETVAAYRSGYLPEERRALEAALLSGRLLGVATTNALELGVDIAGLDAVVLAGYPGTLASFWQQAGRAGRSGDSALVVFVARDDPLDTYLVHHPAALLSRPVESAVLDPANPYVLAPQLACAVAELPLTVPELEVFGGAAAQEVLAELAEQKLLRRRSSGWYWTSRDRPHAEVGIRGTGGEQIAVVESDSGRMLGTVDPGSACFAVHPGAVYLHQGSSYVVDELDLETGLAMVHSENPDWTTTPREVVDISVLSTQEKQDFGGVSVCLGEVAVTSQVVGYLRRRPSGEVLDHTPLDLPEQSLRTRAVWYTISSELLGTEVAAAAAKRPRASADGEAGTGGHRVGTESAGPVGTGKEKTLASGRGPAHEGGRTPGGAGLVPARVPGALHAAEHAAIGLLPLFATCDRWDIGGVSTAWHEDTGEATVFVHDGHPGGAGFAERGYAAIVPWLAATREAIVSCECPTGCPSCVQSPKCGNGNEPLDKAGAVAVLGTVLGALRLHGA
jgi:DEAD/DEAH box helicase domain-containing protein